MNLFPDGFHPNAEGANEIAKIIANAIVNDAPPAIFDNITNNTLTIIFQNPSQSEIVVVGNITDSLFNYTIDDNNGKSVLNGIGLYNNALSIEPLVAGIYFVKIYTKSILSGVKKLTINK